ncbi:RluA family pseudouridine synthase [Lacticaseibacillus hulanensis]|uniref:RluA family pseudouridine synthase n=1 Tax=Lacticaseibacillus hulanensis TaxID=2493111 RepID=UPI000FD78D9B
MPSVRALMQHWLIPKHLQGQLRMTEGITVNGTYQPMSAAVAAGATVELHYAGEESTVKPFPGPIAVIYEDDQLLAVNKPAGLKTHPNKDTDTDTMIARIGHYLGQPAFITHRLDMATSGILLVAKDPLSQAIINRQLATKAAARTYSALVSGDIPDAGTIDAPIGHMDDDIRRREVREDGLPARTHYRVLHRFGPYATVALTLETGRTHQLRVHLAHIGFPIIGDPLYGTESAARMYLHATTMTLTRPFADEQLTISCPANFEVPSMGKAQH